MLIYQSYRYTDFLVNEILPSGVVVHLDNLFIPQLGKLAQKSSDAKIAPAVSVGTAPTHYPPISEPTSTAPKTDNGIQPDTSSQLTAKGLQPSHDKVEIGALKNDAHQQHHSDTSKLTKQGQRKFELQPASGPRRKEKILMRQTSSELLLVGDNEDAGIQRQPPRQSSGTEGNGHNEDQGSPKTSAQLTTEVVDDIEDSEDKDTQETSRAPTQPSSAADWQAYAGASEVFQVDL